MYEHIKRKIQYIEYSNEALSTMMLDIVLSPYVEDGGKEISLIAVNNENEIIKFETQSNFAPMLNIDLLIKSFRETNVDHAKVSISSFILVFYSGNSGIDWVIVVGDNINFIENIIEDIWHSLFEL